MRHECSVFEWGEAGGRVRSWIRFPAEAGEFGVISRLTWDFGQVYLVDRLGIGWGVGGKPVYFTPNYRPRLHRWVIYSRSLGG